VAVLMPSLYLEPFGYVAIEAQMCGTPAITTDWGAFPETVEQGVGGFRCRTRAEFLAALAAAPALDRGEIRRRAVARFGIETVGPQYLAYFDFVWRVHQDGYSAADAIRLPRC
jgi:glycosyltransferase involved in cell wall biosynthesis